MKAGRAKSPILGTTLQIFGENLCEAADLRSVERVLDVAAGNGNATWLQPAVGVTAPRPITSRRCSTAKGAGRWRTVRSRGEGDRNPPQLRLPLSLSRSWLEIFRTWYGPVHKAFDALGEPQKQQALADDLLALIDRFNVAADGTMVAPSDYLEVIVIKN